MRYVFSPTLEEVEDAILAALAADATLASYVRDIRGFQGTMEQALTEASMRDPAILALHVGGAFEERGTWPRLYLARWVLLLRCRNLRGNSYQRRPAATGEAGSYQLLQDVCAVLEGQTLELEDLEPLRVLESDLLEAASSDRTMSVYQLTVAVGVQFVPAPATDDLELVVHTYELRNTEETWPPVAEDQVEIEHE